MTQIVYLRKRFITVLTVIVMAFIAIYVSLASWYLSTVQDSAENQFKNHAEVIAHDLWNLNAPGMRAYLNLAAMTEYFKSFDVRNEEGDLFLHLAREPLSELDQTLLHLHLIDTEDLSFPVVYKNQKIGTLQGKRYVRFVYPLFYLFLIQVFFTITLLFILYLIFHHKILKQKVIDRTKRYQEMVNLLPEMVLETDADGLITFANEIAHERFGLKDLSEHEYNCNTLIQTSDEAHLNFHFSAHVTDKNLEKNEYKALGKDGHTFPVLVRTAPIYGGDQLVGARIVIVDITERNHLLDQLNRDQKMKSIGMMAGGVAHDLNNILSGIINYPELIIAQLPQESPLKQQVERMKEAGLRAAAVVADLLTVARGVAAPQTISCLNTLVQDYMDSPEFQQLKACTPSVSYGVSFHSEICNITCSTIHVRKCLMNLVSNGSEAVSGAGRVDITTSQVELTIPLTGQSTVEPGTYAVLGVCDTGTGISEVEMDHIFEPFYSKKVLGRSGTGLGLAVVWNIMQDHKGGVRVKSSEKGTLFELYFPCSPNTLELSPQQDETETFAGQGQSILIVDDESQQLDIASQFLVSLGYQVSTVSSGEAAVAFLTQQSVDLLLLDMVIGPGLNGRQTYEKVIQLHPGLKAIVMSGFSENEDVKITLDLGAGRLLNKPYTQKDLAKAVFLELQQD